MVFLTGVPPSKANLSIKLPLGKNLNADWIISEKEIGPLG
jgi:hypothetical protein